MIFWQNNEGKDGDQSSNVPRYRKGSFRTTGFEPYSLSIEIDELLLALYFKCIFTRNTAEIMQSIFQLDILTKITKSRVNRIAA